MLFQIPENLLESGKRGESFLALGNFVGSDFAEFTFRTTKTINDDFGGFDIRGLVKALQQKSLVTS